MNINWKLRLKSYPFWVAVFGFIGFIVADSGVLEIGRYEMYVEAVMALLIASGVIVDPTTHGYDDSNRALRYDAPRKDLN
jgi:phi LC3 family holin